MRRIPDARAALTPAALLAAGLGLGGVVIAQDQVEPAPEARLEPSIVPANGAQEALVEVTRYGRYALMVHSLQGAGLQLVDRMAGPGPSDGRAGGEDGRVDVFLDRGTYKLRLDTVEGGKGEVRVVAAPFLEKNGAPLPRLPEVRTVTTTLGDLEQRSWWVDLREGDPRPVVEVAGRNLTDLRLWRDGDWLVDAKPSCHEVTPAEGQPLNLCQLHPSVEPGLYLLTAYGGPPLPWSEGDESPLYLRSGIPALPVAGRLWSTVSPFGVDRYLAHEDTRRFRLELPEPEPAGLLVRDHDAARPFRSDGRSDTITTEDRLPVAEVTGGAAVKVVSISGKAGQPYVLQHFPTASATNRLTGYGPAWVSTVHAGHPQDSVDATSILVFDPVGDEPPRVEAAQALVLDSETAWSRRFNLLSTATVFLEIKKRGEYVMTSTGTAAQFRIEPFYTRRPQGYVSPEYKAGGKVSWDLDPGFYVLTIDPVDPGIAEVDLRRDGLIDAMLDAVGLSDAPREDAVQAATQYPEVNLSGQGMHTLYVGRQPDVPVGIIQRELPLDLTDALPLTLQPGLGPELRFKTEERGQLFAFTETGDALPVALDGADPVQAPELRAGEHTLRVQNPGKDTVISSVWFEPRSRRPDAPLPPITAELLATLPDFPELDAARARTFDLGYSDQKTWTVRVDEPGLYALQSTGLLATEGNLRTRIVPSYRRASENGTGRNFLIQEYLREGDYQLTVSTRGRSAGHLGLALAQTRLVDGGELRDGLPARVELAAGEGVVYTFTVDEAGRYRVRSFGQGRTFRCRLEDADGWPLIAPGVEADVTQALQPGDYRMVVLPEDVPSRRITLIERQADALSFEGHGPHPLPLDAAIQHTWREPGAGQERVPDVWTFTLPADATTRVVLSGDMYGELFNDANERVARSTPGEGWSGPLPRGAYRLEVRNSRRDNRVPYTVRVAPVELVVGLSRSVSAPGTLSISVGDEGLVELASLGGDDVRARLYAPDGTLVASSDDRPQDWNFRAVARLTPGTWRLRVDPVGASSATTTVAMMAPPETVQPPMRLPMVLSLQPGDGVQLIPIEPETRGELIVVRARSQESIGAAVEALVDGRWTTVSSGVGGEVLHATRTGGPATAWRLRVWSLDRRGNPVELRVDALKPARMGEAQLRRGFGVRPPSRAVGEIGAAVATLDRPGVFEPTTGAQPTWWCPTPGATCRPLSDDAIPVGEGELWLVGEAEGGRRPTFLAARASLTDAGVALKLPSDDPVAIDLAEEGGPVIALARAPFGQPGVRIIEGDDVLAPSAGAGGVAVGERAALAVHLQPHRPALALWSAGEPVNGGLEVQLQQRAFPLVTPAPASWGDVDVSIPAGETRAWTLPAVASARLVLDEGLVAVVDGPSGPEVAWADGGVLDVALSGARGTLVILNPGFADGSRARLELTPDADAPPTLSADAPFESRVWRRGRLAVPVAPGDPSATLRVRGAVDAVTLLTADGRVHQGPDLPMSPSGGTLFVDHDVGLVLAWVDGPDQHGDGLWGARALPDPQPVTLPSSTPLAGDIQRLRVRTEAPGLVALRAASPMIVAVQRPEGPPEIHALAEGGAVDAWVPAGDTALTLRAVAGAPLYGRASLSFQQATPVGEGLGPEALLSAGGTRLYAFTAQRDGPIGFGVRAESDVVEATVLDTAGMPVASGLIGMVTVSAGDYLLALHLPPGETPVVARPALAGIEPPDTGPPDDVVRSYLRRAGYAPDGGEE
ncbi:MAG: hypothetical protein H6739_25020 [Alphaproteobacteria bacterium]|nr:hypothetical protein [Alphaproteobacteria bacterium]